jgi:hypothetical protein
MQGNTDISGLWVFWPEYSSLRLFNRDVGVRDLKYGICNSAASSEILAEYFRRNLYGLLGILYNFF